MHYVNNKLTQIFASAHKREFILILHFKAIYNTGSVFSLDFILGKIESDFVLFFLF